MKLQLSSKHIQISKAQSTMLVATVTATVIVVFCLMSARALLKQAAYQRHVIQAQQAATQQLEANVKTAQTLANQYNQVFEGGASNVIGGKNDPSPGAVPPDGDNGRIVLDALPTAYDFPALLTSLSKLMDNDNIGSPTIGGNDQAATADNQPTFDPQPTNIDLSLSGTTSYGGAQKLVKDLQRSVRPFDITQLSLSGSSSSLSLSLNMTTYYQPAKTLNASTKEVQ